MQKVDKEIVRGPTTTPATEADGRKAGGSPEKEAMAEAERKSGRLAAMPTLFDDGFEDDDELTVDNSQDSAG